MPIDINYLREYKKSDTTPVLVGNPQLFRDAQTKRGKDPLVVDQVIALDEEVRALTGSIQSLKKEMNDLQRTVIAPAKKAKEPCDEALAEVAAIRVKIAEIEKQVRSYWAQGDKSQPPTARGRAPL